MRTPVRVVNFFYEAMQRRDQPEIVQHRRGQLAGELMHDVHQLFHPSLRAGDVAVEIPGVQHGSLLQRSQPDVDAGQRLGDDIVQLTADFPAFLFPRGQNLTGQFPQLFLQEMRLLQEPPLVLLAFPEGAFHLLPTDDFLFQLLVRSGQHFKAALRFLGTLPLGDVVEEAPHAMSAGGQNHALNLPFVNLLHAEILTSRGELGRLIRLVGLERVPESFLDLIRDPLPPEQVNHFAQSR